MLLQRKADLAKHKAKTTLTEADASLLLTHSTEVHVAEGDPIFQESVPIVAAYRIKSGKVALSRHGHQFLEAGQV